MMLSVQGTEVYSAAVKPWSDSGSSHVAGPGK